MRSSAAAAMASLVAATAATGSPTNRTRPSASACSSWLTGRMPNGIGRSRPVRTALTPGRARAREASMATRRAWGWGLRSSFAYSMRGRARSSAKRVAPVTLAAASTLGSGRPTTRRPARSAPAIHRLLGGARVLAAPPRRREFHRLVDLEIARAAAQVARERRLDLVACGRGGALEERRGDEEERGRAVAALRGAEFGEGLLQGIEPAAPGQALDGGDAASGAGDAEDEAGEHGHAVEQHGAGAALAQHLEQSVVRGDGDLDGVAVHLEGEDRSGGRHRGRPVILIGGGWGASFRAASRRDLGTGGPNANRAWDVRAEGRAARGGARRPGAGPAPGPGLPGGGAADSQDRPAP